MLQRQIVELLFIKEGNIPNIRTYIIEVRSFKLKQMQGILEK